MLENVRKLKLPLYITYRPVNIIYKCKLDYLLPFQQKMNEVISLRRLKDMIRYKYLSISTSNKRSCQYFFCNFCKSARS